MHGNSSSRISSLGCINYLLPQYVCLFTFDFSGSGLSDGEYVTLGYNEKDDIDCVIKYLRSTQKVSAIGIWGRSMGASAALLYASTD